MKAIPRMLSQGQQLMMTKTRSWWTRATKRQCSLTRTTEMEGRQTAQERIRR